MLFSTAAAPAASFSCLLSFAVESTGPRFHQPALTCAGALAAVPALPGHMATPSHPQPLPWPQHCPQPVSPRRESSRIREACSAVLFEKVVRQAFSRVSREGLCKRHYVSNQLALVQKLIFKDPQSLKLKPSPQKSKNYIRGHFLKEKFGSVAAFCQKWVPLGCMFAGWSVVCTVFKAIVASFSHASV